MSKPDQCARHVGEKYWTDITLCYMAAKRLRRQGRKANAYGCSQCKPNLYYVMDLTDIVAPDNK